MASPSFSQYPYAWLRDGAFVAEGLDLVGELDRSGRFHDWVASVILSSQAGMSAPWTRLAAASCRRLTSTSIAATTSTAGSRYRLADVPVGWSGHLALVPSAPPTSWWSGDGRSPGGCPTGR